MTQSGEQNDSLNDKWEAIYRRLEAVQQKIAQSIEPNAEQQKAILKERAKEMARRPLQIKEEVPELEIVEFRMAHEIYGFESRFIREVYPLKDVCPIPCTPAYVLGLMNVRGRLISLLDLKKFFGLSIQELDNHNQAIILHNEPLQHDSLQDHSLKRINTGGDVIEIGILADALLGVYPVALESLQPALPTLTGLRQEFLLGITTERVIVLDAEKLLSSRDIVVYEEVET